MDSETLVNTPSAKAAEEAVDSRKQVDYSFEVLALLLLQFEMHVLLLLEKKLEIHQFLRNTSLVHDLLL
jgi:hypothetical protein